MFSGTLLNQSYALTQQQAEDFADLAAVFVFLKQDCGYQQSLSNQNISRALLSYANHNRWQLDNYAIFDMNKLVDSRYLDLKGIPVQLSTKCQALAKDSMGLVAFAR